MVHIWLLDYWQADDAILELARYSSLPIWTHHSILCSLKSSQVAPKTIEQIL